MSSPSTPNDEILSAITTLRETFNSKVTLSYDWRMKQLKTLLKLIDDEALQVALYNDLHRSKFESSLLELDMIRGEINVAMNNLDSWMRPQSRSTNLANLPATSKVIHDPLGVTLIMSPWNYPLLLTFQPLVGAFAAGNTALLRPANYSDKVSTAIHQLIDKYFNKGQGPNLSKGLPVYTILGDRHVTDFVLNQQFDYIFFTGGPHLGKIVLSKASQFLTPCTIELGGKSPCVVDRDCGDLDVVAKRIVWGAFINSGQTCVRPDYGLVHSSVLPKLLPLLRKYILEFYGNYNAQSKGDQSGDELEYHFMAGASTIAGNATSVNNKPSVGEEDSLLQNRSSSDKGPIAKPSEIPPSPHSTPSFNSILQANIDRTAIDINYGTFEDAGADGGKKTSEGDVAANFSAFRSIAHSPYFGRIVNNANYDRLVNCIKTDRASLYCGGVVDKTSRFISPTLLSFSDYPTFAASESMREELFGPIFPICTFDDLSQVVTHIRSNPKPLAAYCFTTSCTTKDVITTQTSSGSLLFNDCIVQLSNHDLPFGGVGFSGYGNYHGFASFQTFSHQKAVLYKTTWFDIFARYPPYSHVKRKVFGGLHCIEGCGNGIGRAWSVARRVWCDKIPGLIQFVIVLAVLAGIGCGVYWGIYPQWMKLMRMWVEKHYGTTCR